MSWVSFEWRISGMVLLNAELKPLKWFHDHRHQGDWPVVIKSRDERFFLEPLWLSFWVSRELHTAPVIYWKSVWRWVSGKDRLLDARGTRHLSPEKVTHILFTDLEYWWSGEWWEWCRGVDVGLSNLQLNVFRLLSSYSQLCVGMVSCSW